MGNGSGKLLLGQYFTLFPFSQLPITNHSEKYANKTNCSLYKFSETKALNQLPPSDSRGSNKVQLHRELVLVSKLLRTYIKFG